MNKNASDTTNTAANSLSAILPYVWVLYASLVIGLSYMFGYKFNVSIGVVGAIFVISSGVMSMRENTSSYKAVIAILAMIGTFLCAVGSFGFTTI